MGRGKNNRRRASLDGPAPSMCSSNDTSSFYNQLQPGSSSPTSTAITPTSTQEIRDTIEFHWRNLSLDLKQFLLTNPSELSLRKFVDYWNNPVRVENTSPNIAASICGCSWYLALNYMGIKCVVEARALILNGCFLQQCYNKPIEEIATIARSVSGDSFRSQLPYFTDGLLAISSEERMSTFLRNKVSSDYQRRMSFATQTTQSKKRVQDYVNQISSDWSNGKKNSSSTTNGKAARHKSEIARRRRASLDNGTPLLHGEQKVEEESYIELKLIDTTNPTNHIETTMKYDTSQTLKSLFKQYAEDRNLSLRSLRFSYEGSTLFLSSAGNKTPSDFGMKNADRIMVVNNEAQKEQQKQMESESGGSSSDESKGKTRGGRSTKNKSKNKKKRRPCRRASWAGPEVIIDEDERLKLVHSRQLSRVFTEVAPQFEMIRQRLNTLNLTCAPPKQRRVKKSPVAIDPLLYHVSNNNPSSDGLGGKAGVPFYAVHIGDPENLYNTSILAQIQSQKSLSIDLHGLTKSEAIHELDAKLPTWIDIAMRGAYPWVIPVVIICGGGNQILSEAVNEWIRGNENVAKAPKKKFSRRRSI